mgnify:CR=1 FL=1
MILEEMENIESEDSEVYQRQNEVPVDNDEIVQGERSASPRELPQEEAPQLRPNYFDILEIPESEYLLESDEVAKSLPFCSI